MVVRPAIRKMKILALDTATLSCSAAIVDDGMACAELTTVNTQTHSKHLMSMIDTVCDMSGLKIADMDGFAVTIGPGSFTGLRIGISTVKGLAWSLNKPVVGISSLDALAWQCIPAAYPVCTLLDARKQEVYYCRYRFQDGKLKKDRSEQVIALAGVINDIREPCIFIGNGANLYKEEILEKLGELAHFAGWNQDIIRASSVAGLSLERFVHHQTDDVALLVPHYIRKSDAELHRKRDNF
jgi:tRNA threonylcarbamoyladenosine biosynthesis protein TsaB